MNKFGSDIKLRVDNLKSFLTNNRERLKTAILPLLIGIAVLFFWVYGSSDTDEIVIEDVNSDKQDVEQVEKQESQESKSGNIYVDISGAVDSPGVYMVRNGTRLFEVIEMAGGLLNSADIDGLNQAETVTDGQKIIVYEKGDEGSNNAAGGTANNKDSTRININYADSAELQMIPGIGPSKAERIIEYRNMNGRFDSVEDLKNITGIGDKTLESIKEYITV